MSLVLDRDPPVAVMSSKDRQPPSGNPPKVVSTGRLKADRQTLDEMYQPPTNFLEIEVCKPFVHKDEKGRNKFTDYEIRMRTNLPVFPIKEISVRRRYSDFDWLRREIQKSIQIYIPELPGKALAKQISTLGTSKNEGIYEETFIEIRRQGLEGFINNLAGHPLVQNEKALHLFLQEKELNKSDYIPGKIRR